MARDKLPFLSRWSRRKLAAESEPAPRAPAAPAGSSPARPELPPLDQLGFDSEYKGFLHPAVDEALRRKALKKLFASPHFNVPDMLDDFAEDYTLLESLPAEAVERLTHGRRTLLGERQEAPAPEDARVARAEPREGVAPEPGPEPAPARAPGEGPQANASDKDDGAAG